MADNLNLSMFRAYDIRTPAVQLTESLARQLADSVATYFLDVVGTRQVIVGHDARSTGPAFLAIAVEAYRDAGLEVIYLPGVVSTPYLYYVAMRFPQAAAVMFGASHNPAGDTGQKLVAPGVEPIAMNIGPAGGLAKIREYYVARRCCKSQSLGTIRAVDFIDDYIDYSMQLAGVLPGGLHGLRILQDYLFGAAGREMMLAFTRAGAELSPLHFAADGHFPIGDPNPVKQEVIQAGRDALANGQFHLANFFDGDGDRIDFYHGDGRYLSSSFTYAALLPEIKGRFPGDDWRVYADLKSNPLALIEMARTGVYVDVIRNGHSQIKQCLHQDARSIGAVEESAHFYEAFPMDGNRYCTENALYIALLAARVWHQDRPRIERLLELQSTVTREREWGYKFASDSQLNDALQATAEFFRSQGATAMQRMANGMDLEATLLRRGLPFDIDQHTQLDDDWLQISQRASQSEDHLARWEIVGANPQTVKQAKQEVTRLVAQFDCGDEYQG